MQNFFSIASRKVPNTIQEILSRIRMFSTLIDSLTQSYANMTYMDIFILMALESSIVPVPSELVMIPAGYLANIGNLNPYIAILMG